MVHLFPLIYMNYSIMISSKNGLYFLSDEVVKEINTHSDKVVSSTYWDNIIYYSTETKLVKYTERYSKILSTKGPFLNLRYNPGDNNLYYIDNSLYLNRINLDYLTTNRIVDDRIWSMDIDILNNLIFYTSSRGINYCTLKRVICKQFLNDRSILKQITLDIFTSTIYIYNLSEKLIFKLEYKDLYSQEPTGIYKGVVVLGGVSNIIHISYFKGLMIFTDTTMMHWVIDTNNTRLVWKHSLDAYDASVSYSIQPISQEFFVSKHPPKNRSLKNPLIIVVLLSIIVSVIFICWFFKEHTKRKNLYYSIYDSPKMSTLINSDS